MPDTGRANRFRKPFVAAKVLGCSGAEGMAALGFYWQDATCSTGCQGSAHQSKVELTKVTLLEMTVFGTGLQGFSHAITFPSFGVPGQPFLGSGSL